MAFSKNNPKTSAKKDLIRRGFEPRPPERLEPYSSALDQLGHLIDDEKEEYFDISIL
jgi:hypothetical protein